MPCYPFLGEGSPTKIDYRKKGYPYSISKATHFFLYIGIRFPTVSLTPFQSICFSPTAESFGVSAQIGSGVVRGGPEVRFHEGSTRVPRGSTRAAGCER